jgi:hypothetical protein
MSKPRANDPVVEFYESLADAHSRVLLKPYTAARTIESLKKGLASLVKTIADERQSVQNETEQNNN